MPITYVVLLRGVNVGGDRRLPMADLRAICTEAGCEAVSTYIQSGNVVLTSTAAAAKLAAELERRIEEGTGLDVPVVVRSAAELTAVVERNPFGHVTDPTRLVVSFLRKRPSTGAAKALDPEAFAPDEFVLGRHEVYLHLPNGQARAKLSPPVLEKALGVPATARNWKTVTTLLDLAETTANAAR